MTPTTVAGPRSLEVLFLPLTRDGRVEDPAALRKIGKLLPAVTDCFLFCHGWLYERADAKREAARFFALLDAALRPLGDRVVPLRIALYWPSRPLTAEVERGVPGDGVWPALVREASDPARRDSPDLARLLLDLCEAEVPLVSKGANSTGVNPRRETRKSVTVWVECRIPPFRGDSEIAPPPSESILEALRRPPAGR